MGLGKTIQSISILALIEGRKTKEELSKPRKDFHIVIVPKVTLNKWRKECEKWFPTMRLLVFYGNQ